MVNRLPTIADINAFVLVKGAEQYVFKFDDARLAETLQTLRRFAANPDLSFSWSDAAVLTDRIREWQEDGTG